MHVYLRNFLIPGLTFMFAILFSVRYGNIWLGYRDVILFLPYFLLGTSALISLFFLQFYYVYTAIVFASVYAFIQLHLQSTLADPITYSSFVFVNLLFPILLMLSVLFGRKTPFSASVIGLMLLTSSLLWFPNWIQSADMALWSQWVPSAFFIPLFEGTWFSLGLLVTYVPVMIFLSLLYFLNPTLLTAHWIVGLLMTACVFVLFGIPFVSAVSFSLFSALLLLSFLTDAFQLAYVDELTSIPSRKALEKKMMALGRKYAIAMLDVDHFKKFNDTHGHDVGDQVLRMVAGKINQVRGGGKAYRYGGEEFTILFPGKSAEQAEPMLEIVRESVAQYVLRLRTPERPKNNKAGKKQRHGAEVQGVSVTISIGVAERNTELPEPKDVLKAADTALYSAKKAGRNCVKRLPN